MVSLVVKHYCNITAMSLSAQVSGK